MKLHRSELVIDSFAGGGGASLGIEMALGRTVDIAINHDAEAIAMHAINHPTTRHYRESVWAIDPATVTAGRRPALAWFSPDCKHFSKAKGGKPLEKAIRGLAWVVIRWAQSVRPRVIILENVEEFETWGPLLDDGKPDPEQKGATYRRWIAELEGAGYVVESRLLRACDYGAPTIRKRLFVIARSDGEPIVWPEPTHGAGRILPWRTAAECIDWSIPCPSIFTRKRPLAEKTLRRIARGTWRFVIDAATPFIIPVTHAGDLRGHSVGEPLRTVTGAHRGEQALVAPSLIRTDMHKSNAHCVYPPGDPLRTVTSSGGHALVAPTLIQTGYGERPGQAPRCLDLHKPLGTVVGGGCKTALCASNLVKLYGTCRDGQPVDAPAPTIRAQGTHVAEVRAFLSTYYGEGTGSSLADPMRTVTTRDRFGLVSVEGFWYQIDDIGMRMLVPRELFRAQGFPDTYEIAPVVDGKPLTKTAQVRMAGNSVCPPLAAALVRANVSRRRPPMALQRGQGELFTA